MRFEVDTERLGREAEALGAHRTGLERTRTELGNACAIARSACGRFADGGLAGALGRLENAWKFDVEAIARDTQAMSEVMRSLSRMYAAADQENARALRD